MLCASCASAACEGKALAAVGLEKRSSRFHPPAPQIMIALIVLALSSAYTIAEDKTQRAYGGQ